MENLIGKQIVGYRYGVAPESGYSWNFQENARECGVSMAQVGYLPEVASFAVDDVAEDCRRYYYIGTIAGTGGDDEICLTDVKALTRAEYLKLRKEQTETNLMLADWWLEKKTAYWRSEIYYAENKLYNRSENDRKHALELIARREAEYKNVIKRIKSGQKSK